MLDTRYCEVRIRAPEPWTVWEYGCVKEEEEQDKNAFNNGYSPLRDFFVNYFNSTFIEWRKPPICK